MTRQPRRLPEGGLIDRNQPLSFTFNGERLEGFTGDTVASALLANGKGMVARSFKYHRPRGIYAAGVEEPSALVTVGDGARREPNAKASQVVLCEGMQVESQNHWPSLGFDLLRLNDRLSPVFSTGFYNKTFKWPRRFWPLYEKMLRKIAGMGSASSLPDTSDYEQIYAHCDVLIVGAGPAGLAAALALAGTRLHVVLVDENPRIGGWLLRERATVDGQAGSAWVQRVRDRLEASENVRVLERTTAFGYYDHNLLALCEQSANGEQRLWRLRAARVILATGAIERPLVFGNNDLPGVMLAGAARTYVNQYAVAPGENAVIYTNNDSAYRTAADLTNAGIGVRAIVDTRHEVGDSAEALAVERSIPTYKSASLEARGRNTLRSVLVEAGNRPHALPCDLLCVSGGWTPTLHLHAQAGGSNEYRADLDAFVPGQSKQACISAGGVAGLHRIADCLADGRHAALEVADSLDIEPGNGEPTPPASLVADAAPAAIASTPQIGVGKQFVDLQNDVTTKDLRQAHRENYVSVEHLKRYTTLGMGTDQGKTSNLNGLGLLAELRGEPVPLVGTTTFRPPYTPVTMGVVAGRLKDANLHPTRRTVLHVLHEQAGARFDFNGLWLRPQCYPLPGETVGSAIRREALTVRQKAGITDISTLGKFEIQGTDCLRLLNRVYVNNWDKLAVGRARYGLMLRDDGMVLDDGTVTRVAEDRYFITTSTGHAEHILQHLEYLLDVAWPELDVNLLAVTEQWAGVALAGPRSRDILRPLLANEDLDALPYMGFMLANIGGREARIVRISFSGELAYEVYVPASAGAELWQQLTAIGDKHGLVPYGMDAMDVLRIEKGFIVVGADADGRTTPYDIGFDRMVSSTKRFVGSHALTRPALHEAGRLQLVGLKPVSSDTVLREGAQLIANPDDRGFYKSVGHISSAGLSPTLERYVALAQVKDGRDRIGQTLYVFDPVRDKSAPQAVEITEPCAYDPEGERVRA